MVNGISSPSLKQMWMAGIAVFLIILFQNRDVPKVEVIYNQIFALGPEILKATQNQTRSQNKLRGTDITVSFVLGHS